MLVLVACSEVVVGLTLELVLENLSSSPLFPYPFTKSVTSICTLTLGLAPLVPLNHAFALMITALLSLPLSYAAYPPTFPLGSVMFSSTIVVVPGEEPMSEEATMPA